MNSVKDTRKFIDSAEGYFARAVSDDDAQVAVVALELVGRAALGGDPSASFDLSPQFVARLSEHTTLVARAASMLGVYCEMDGEQALPKMLYARSGYQILLDAEIWPTPPLDSFHLEESDEEILDLVARVHLSSDQLPRYIPTTHGWWPHR